MILAGVRLVVACLFLVLSLGASDGSRKLATNGARQINIGEQVTDTLTAHGTEKLYQLKASTDGTLILRLNWQQQAGVLELQLAGRLFAQRNSTPFIMAKLPVVAGQTYSVTVRDGAPLGLRRFQLALHTDDVNHQW